MKTAAKIISWIFHPVFAPVAGIFILLNSGSYISLLPPEAQRYIYIITALATVFIPLLIFPSLHTMRLISSYQVSDHRERIYPMLVTALAHFLGFYIFYRIDYIPREMELFLLASGLSVLLAGLVSLRWKISAHMIGMGGLTALSIALFIKYHVNMVFYLILLFIIAGLTGSARLKLNEHSPPQIYAGFSLGFIVVLLIVYLL